MHTFSHKFIPIKLSSTYINPLNAELNPICHLLALLGAHHILHVSRIRVNNCPKRCDVAELAWPRWREVAAQKI